MQYITYILYSNLLDKYYMGSSSMTIEQRLLYHHSNHSGFTSRAKDWEVVYVKMFSKKSEALNFEKKIKSWKSKKMIRALISDNSKIE